MEQVRGRVAGTRSAGSSRHPKEFRLDFLVEDCLACGIPFSFSDSAFFSPRYDEDHSGDDKVFLDCFCKIAAGIKNNSNGHQLKDLILQKGITQNALDYMKKHIPSAKK